MDSKLHKKLSERHEKGTLRSLSSFEGLVDFYSNDYLGWAQEPISFIGNSGATGSRLISGNSKVADESEAEIAKYFNSESALMFSSGYDANIGFFSAVPQKDDTILYDSEIHASVRDGIRMGIANSFSFRHNNLQHLEEKLSKTTSGAIYVAVESLYSMNGDTAPLNELVSLCERYGAYLIVDEAHAGGVLGEQGKGLGFEFSNRIFARVITFGKAYGSHGACVLSNSDLRDYLVNFARSFIYTTALPNYVFSHNAAIVSNDENLSRMEMLQENLKYFRESMFGDSLPSDTRSPIQIVPVGSINETKRLAERIISSGISVKPIFSPTVPEGKECIRICIHAFNTKEEMDRLIKVLS